MESVFYSQFWNGEAFLVKCAHTAKSYTTGSSHHEHFQKTLKDCKERLVNKKPVPIKLSYEPVNIRDQSAILVHACLEIRGSQLVTYQVWKSVIQNSEISSMKITSIGHQYVFSISSFRYFVTVSITKKGRWLKNKNSYTNNEYI